MITEDVGAKFDADCVMAIFWIWLVCTAFNAMVPGQFLRRLSR